MSEPRDIVGDYTKLSYIADQLAARGQTVPTSISAQIQQIERRATAMLGPDQLRYVQQHVESTKAQWHERDLAEARAGAADRQQKALERNVRQMTEGMFGLKDGLSLEQMDEMRTKGRVTIKPPGKPDRKKLDKQSKKATAAIDPTGEGYTRAEWEDMLDELVEAPAEALDERITKLGLRADKRKMRKAVENWRTESVGLEMQRRTEKELRKQGEEVIELSDEDKLRNELLFNTLEDVENNGDDRWMSRMTDSISEDLLNEDGVRGDVARAFSDVEESADYDE